MMANDFATLIAAVRRVQDRLQRRGFDGDASDAAALRAVQAVLEGLVDREWLAREIIHLSSAGINIYDRAGALRAALLARAGGS